MNISSPYADYMNPDLSPSELSEIYLKRWIDSCPFPIAYKDLRSSARVKIILDATELKS